MNNESEIWKPVVGYEGLYEVSNLGRIKSLSRLTSCHGYFTKSWPEKILHPTIQNNGYMSLPLYKHGVMKRYSVHRLVAMAFIENPNDYSCVDHIDTDKTNNRVDNLRWCNHKSNSNNPKTIESMKRFFANLSQEQISSLRTAASKAKSKTVYVYDENITKLINSYYNVGAAHEQLGLSKTTIQRYCKSNKVIKNMVLSYEKLIL